MKMCVAEQKNAPAMKKPVAKEDAPAANKKTSIVAKNDAPTEENKEYDAKNNVSNEKEEYDAKDDASTEEKEDTMQKEDAPTLEKPHNNPVLAAMSVASGEVILMNHKELYVTVSDSD
jgi:hypothetical protein